MTPNVSALDSSGRSYGASELRAAYQRYWLTAFGIAVSCHLMVLVSYSLIGPVVQKIPKPGPDFVMIRDIFLQPPVGRPVPPKVHVTPTKPAWNHQIPLPAAESNVNLDPPPQDALTAAGSRGDGSPGIGGPRTDASAGGFEVPQQPVPFAVVEHPPMLVISAVPVYPRVARLSEIEGQVVVRILVGIAGKPDKVEIESSTNEVFNESALQAARKFVFTPGAMSSGPVAVWVSIPFTFRLVGAGR
jgi:periplasmic protein TonB